LGRRKIPPYQPANAGFDYQEQRDRKLLLQKVQIRRLVGIASQKGLTFVPLRLYTKEHYKGYGKIKLEFGICRGKKNSISGKQLRNEIPKEKLLVIYQDINNKGDGRFRWKIGQTMQAKLQELVKTSKTSKVPNLLAALRN